MERVLVLEDDEHFREVLVEAVESLDFQVHSADSARLALHLGQEFDFDLVISDIRMAGPTDGLGVLQALKQRRSLACIVITGYADHTAPLRALQIRVDDYLYKPFEVDDLIAAIERVRQSLSKRTWYRQILHRLLGQIASDADLLALQKVRESCLKSFFVAVRSQHLHAETALALWDPWEELEVDYLKVANISSISAETTRTMLDRYKLWQARLERATRDKSFVSPAQRSPEKVERASFRVFVARITEAKVSAEELGLAVAVRRIPADRRKHNPELSRLYERMWS